MYIIRKTQSTYRLTALPFSNWLMGVIIIVAMVFLFRLISGDTTLTCKRSSNGQGECVIDTRGHQKTFPVNELVGAKVDGTKAFSVSILTKVETIPLGSSSTSNYSGVAAEVDKINSFMINRDLESVQVDNSDQSLAWLLTIGIFTLVALGSIVFSRIIVLELDKNRDSLIMHWKGIITKQQLNCKLSSIKQVTYLPALTGRGGTSGYFIMLTTKQGEEMPLTGITSSWLRARSVANSLKDFLGINE